MDDKDEYQGDPRDVSGVKPLVPSVAVRKRHLSPATMEPDEYAAAVTEERNAALDVEEKAMDDRHVVEKANLELVQKGEVEALAKKREQIKAETVAIQRYHELWRRQAAEASGAKDPSVFRARHDDELAALARETGFDVMPPAVGNTSYPGFLTPLPGHPWIRAYR